jgi:pimeloyl-ACP methyl ester carboxylesterase
MGRLTLILSITALAVCSACGRELASPEIGYVAVDSAVTLEVVDWGGAGTPIVLLAGLGHTAHVFDEFAPQLTDSYHVLGITRRGFGASSQPEVGYDIPTLVEDIRTVLDSLNLDRVVLAGHSLGGDEMTMFARTHPERLKALVYIEAAYNRVAARDSLAGIPVPEPSIDPPTDDDLQSAAAYQLYYEKANGVMMPLTEIKAMYRWAADGRLDGAITPGWVYSVISGNLQDPDYSGIGVPALAIYGVDYPVTELFLDYEGRDSVTQRQMRARHEAGLRVDKLSHTYFRTHMSDGQVVEIEGAGHSLYITHRWETVAAIREFLGRRLR